MDIFRELECANKELDEVITDAANEQCLLNRASQQLECARKLKNRAEEQLNSVKQIQVNSDEIIGLLRQRFDIAEPIARALVADFERERLLSMRFSVNEADDDVNKWQEIVTGRSERIDCLNRTKKRLTRKLAELTQKAEVEVNGLRERIAAHAG